MEQFETLYRMLAIAFPKLAKTRRPAMSGLSRTDRAVKTFTIRWEDGLTLQLNVLDYVVYIKGGMNVAKTIVTVEYVTQLKEFLTLLSLAQDTKADPSGTVWFESGRKFDKVMVGNTVRYFIDRSKGIIYGSKSRLAPNMKWYFGTLSSASKWDWSGFHGTPVLDDTVKLIGEYGDYKHYEPLT